MKSRSRLLTAGLILGLLFSVISPVMTHAIEGESIAISPTRLDMDVKAGETKTGKFTVLNNGTIDYDFKVYGTPYSVKGRTYESDFFNKASNGDAYTWVKFDKELYSLEANGRVEVNYTIDVPADASPGGHYGVLFAETQSKAQEGTQVIRKKRVGMIMYVTVDGDVIRQGRVENIRIDPFQVGNRQLDAMVTINNNGNTNFQADSLIRIKNILNNTVYERKMANTIMPKTTRDIQLMWNDGPSFGIYKVSVESKVLDDVKTGQSWVLLMPTWMVFVIVFVIGGALYLFFRRRR